MTTYELNYMQLGIGGPKASFVASSGMQPGFFLHGLLRSKSSTHRVSPALLHLGNPDSLNVQNLEFSLTFREWCIENELNLTL